MEFIGLLALLGSLAVATLIGFLWRTRQGRVRREAETLIDSKFLDLAMPITVIQFGSEYCAYCPQQWRLIDEIVSKEPGLAKRSLDVAAVPELAGRLRISQTPTTVLVSSGGEVLSRIGGLAKRETLLREIEYAKRKRKEKNDEYLI